MGDTVYSGSGEQKEGGQLELSALAAPAVWAHGAGRVWDAPRGSARLSVGLACNQQAHSFSARAEPQEHMAGWGPVG